MVKLAGQFVPLKVNYEKEGADLAKMYKVTALPTVLFIDAEGDVWGKIVGYHQSEPFKGLMNGIINARKPYLKAKQLLRRRPNDGAANALVAQVYGKFGKLMQATSAIKKLEAARYKGEDLAAVYSVVGKGFQDAGDFNEAINYFVKAQGAGIAAENPKDISYALILIVDCYASIGDITTAKKYALQLVRLTGAAKQHVDRARKFLGSG